MGKLRPHRRVAVGVLAAAVAAVTVWMLLLGPRGATIASVLGFSVAVAGLVVALVKARAEFGSNDRLLGAARQVARDVRNQEAAVLARLMADSGDLKPAEVSFAWPAPIYGRDDGGDRRGGMLSNVEGYYRSLNHGRLVVLGEPGSGKTVIAIQLVLDLTAAVLAVADDTRRLPRVPVRLSLPAFDLGNEVDVAAPEVVSARLDNWLTRHLETVFGLPAKIADTLVSDGWILPVLDGLDEMDPDDALPRRAASVIRAINHFSAGNLRPVVITCRTNRYQQLSGRFESGGNAPLAEETSLNTGRYEMVVLDATVVVAKPLSPSNVIDYLTYRFPDPADPHRIEPRWRPIIERLTASNVDDDLLATALGSPLRLFLTVTAYRHHTSRPEELSRLATITQLDEHLFARLVPAVVEQHPLVGRQYAASKVTRWLTTLARHLAEQGERGGSPSDLRLDRLWPAAGWRAPRYAAAAVTTTAAGVLLAFGVFARWPPDVLPILGVAAFVVLVAWIASRPTVDLRRLDLSGLYTFAGRRRIGRLLVIGFTAGLAAGLMMATVSTLVGLVGVLKFSALGLVGAFLIGLGSGPTVRPTALDRPSRLVQQGMVYTITALVVVPLIFVFTDMLISGKLEAGLVGALIAGLGTWLAVGLVIGSASGLVAGLAVGLKSNAYFNGVPFAIAALVVGLIFVANSPWPRYLFAAMFLALREDLPRRPAVFMDWTYQAGLMRLSGIAVQFRHREFQTWLAIRDQSGDGPRPQLLTAGPGGSSTGNKE
jgi:MFS family permease